MHLKRTNHQLVVKSKRKSTTVAARTRLLTRSMHSVASCGAQPLVPPLPLSPPPVLATIEEEEAENNSKQHAEEASKAAAGSGAN